ncbi:hypothetical protein LZA78_00645 [Sinirhodobacter sp. WL0062]|uniref:Uncharacterized protein n=1 Tax=Rhodobacter flavimaris TaxID=2907145 RepID=A0ABS8YQ19_9RHOB|nr:hypothetical protein [Sinirhodobacter sp. WL0062]MCE5971997.1 hypothetical protein [Sinirhodobacter sp. WL0062]
MKSGKFTRLASLTLGALLLGSAAMAGHNNPWATEDDTILSQYHEENLTQSVDTPGEDEMLGVMVQNARGKLEDDLGQQRQSGSGRH